MNDSLVRYLDSISKDLLEYLAEDNELPVDVAGRMRDSATAPLAGETRPARLSEEWPDWFHLVGAFVATHGWEGTDNVEGSAPFLAPADANLVHSDRAAGLAKDQRPEGGPALLRGRALCPASPARGS